MHMRLDLFGLTAKCSAPAIVVIFMALIYLLAIRGCLPDAAYKWQPAARFRHFSGQ
jgi:hypothetical protein